MKRLTRAVALSVMLSLFLSLTLNAHAAKKSDQPAYGPAGGFIYRYKNEIQERFNNNGKWQKKDSRKESSFDPIRVSSFRNINSLSTDANHSNIVFEYAFRKGYPKDIENRVRIQSVEAAKKLSRFFEKKIQIKLVGITEKDIDFVENELPSIVPQDSYGDSLEILKDYGTVYQFYSRGGTGGGSAGYSSARGYGYYLSHTSSLATLKTLWPTVAPHEMTHVLQDFYTRDVSNPYGEGGPKSKINGHLIEGSANTVGMALAYSNLGWYSDEMDRILKMDIRDFVNKYPINNIDDAVKFIKDIETRDSERTMRFSYSAGQLVWEFYIAKYGFEKYVELLKNVRTAENFDENLKSTIGKDRDSFYLEAADYVLRTWKRLS